MSRKSVAALCVTASSFLAALVSPVLAQSHLTSYYNRNLATSEFFWGRVLQEDTPLTPIDGGLESKGSWKIDTNHMEYGLLVGPAVIWTNGSKKGLPIAPDLVNAMIEVSVDFEEGGAGSSPPLSALGAQLVFWFQTQLRSEWDTNPTRMANYIWKEDLLPYALEKGPSKRPKLLKLSSSLDDWTCLSRQRRDVRAWVGSAAVYSCALNQAEFKTSMSAVKGDMGLLIVLDWKKWADGGWADKPNAWTSAWNTAEGQQVLHDSRLVLKSFKIVR